MATEIEAKFRLVDDAAIREALQREGARPLGMVLENNTYFDWPDGSLCQGDCGLRIRVAQPLAESSGRAQPGVGPKVTITYKGPREPGPFKTRQELEFRADDPAAVAEVLAALGLAVVLRFQKRRRSWQLGACRVELDELPLLGRFLEIEGPDEDAVEQARRRLGLGQAPVENRPYVAMLELYCREQGLDQRDIHF